MKSLKKTDLKEHRKAKDLEKQVPLQVEQLLNDNAELLLQNAMQDVAIQSLQDENAELMFKIAMMEASVNV